MDYGLKEDIIQRIQSVLSNFPEIEEATLYGSRAKGNCKNDSDIDLTLKGKNLTLLILGKVDNSSTICYCLTLLTYPFIIK